VNEFEDCVARQLTLAEQAVWHRLFRWWREGKSSTSTRGTASAVNVTPKTVTAALRWLKDRGLIWEIAKSTNKGSASLCGVHPRPGQFVQLCETANGPRLSKRQRDTTQTRKPR
jgi:DNA-binding transcriptional MocR family regulator